MLSVGGGLGQMPHPEKSMKAARSHPSSTNLRMVSRWSAEKSPPLKQTGMMEGPAPPFEWGQNAAPHGIQRGRDNTSVGPSSGAFSGAPHAPARNAAPRSNAAVLLAVFAFMEASLPAPRTQAR